MEANARTREFVRQYRAATKAAKRSGGPMIDEMTALQVRDHASLSPTEMADRMRDVAPKAVRGRRRTPGLLRAVPSKPGAPIEGTWKLGYLIGTIMNRDYWMHRVDLTRATGRELVLTPEHDGRIVADIVADWARIHAQPFHLALEGLRPQAVVATALANAWDGVIQWRVCRGRVLSERAMVSSSRWVHC